MAGLPDAPFAEVSKLVPPGVTDAVPALPVEEAGSPGCSDVTDCSSDWSTRVAMASTLWVASGGGGRVGVLLTVFGHRVTRYCLLQRQQGLLQCQESQAAHHLPELSGTT